MYLKLIRSLNLKDLNVDLDVIKDVGPQGITCARNTPGPICAIFIIHHSSDQQDQDGKTRDPREIASSNSKNWRKITILNHCPRIP